MLARSGWHSGGPRCAPAYLGYGHFSSKYVAAQGGTRFWFRSAECCVLFPPPGGVCLEHFEQVVQVPWPARCGVPAQGVVAAVRWVSAARMRLWFSGEGVGRV